MGTQSVRDSKELSQKEMQAKWDKKCDEKECMNEGNGKDDRRGWWQRSRSRLSLSCFRIGSRRATAGTRRSRTIGA